MPVDINAMAIEFPLSHKIDTVANRKDAHVRRIVLFFVRSPLMTRHHNVHQGEIRKRISPRALDGPVFTSQITVKSPSLNRTGTRPANLAGAE